MEALHTTKNNAVLLKPYDNLNIEQLGVCSAKLRYTDKVVRCKFFVVPGDGPALLGKPDIKLLCILKITCDVIEGQQADRMFVSQTIEPSSSLSCKANTDIVGRSDNAGVV